ncbi:MAG: aminoacyl-tRNA hydrolase [Flavobacteriales bacterium]|nr:aminoacyl-tRNA hydrolase [Flavobacteriales bacterium]
MKYLIVGLGNPGPEYANTRHNVGFRVVEALAKHSEAVFATDRYAERAEVRSKGRTLVLIKPSTFMNLSGNAVRYWMDKEKVPRERVLVITDDLALPFGKLRLRKEGGAGGHNGLAHIIEVLGTQDFPRLRFGIGADFARGAQVHYVLDRWSEEEAKSLDQQIARATEAVRDLVLMGVSRAMNVYNAK